LLESPVVISAKQTHVTYFIIVLVTLELESDKWQAFTVTLTQNDEASLFKTICQVIRDADQVGHDRTESAFAETNQYIVLTNNRRGALGEIQCQGSLICT
jgi:hypothetical protein